MGRQSSSFFEKHYKLMSATCDPTISGLPCRVSAANGRGIPCYHLDILAWRDRFVDNTPCSYKAIVGNCAEKDSAAGSQIITGADGQRKGYQLMATLLKFNRMAPQL